MLKGFALLLFCTFLLAPSGEGRQGEVVSVTDGDTLKVRIGSEVVRVRLAEIDSPELRQPWGVESRQALSRKVLGKKVRILSLGYDRYKRLLAHIYQGKQHINYELVKEGHAWAYLKYLRDEEILFAEKYAQGRGLGLWAGKKDRAIAPWKWRKGKREK